MYLILDGYFTNEGFTIKLYGFKFDYLSFQIVFKYKHIQLKSISNSFQTHVNLPESLYLKNIYSRLRMLIVKLPVTLKI